MTLDTDARDTEMRLRTVETNLTTHEAVCAERYYHILEDLKTVKHNMSATNRIILGIGLALMAGMATILTEILF